MSGSASEQQDSYDNSQDAHALAEAYPEEVPAVIQEAQRQEDQSVNEVAPPLGFAPVPEGPATEAFPVQEDVPLATSAPVAPVAPAGPKVHIELDDDDEDDDFSPFPPKGKGKNNGVPSYSFFPINFGRTNGGAIAVANAFSTGKGAARSHAIAYGSSAAKRSAGKHLDVA